MHTGPRRLPDRSGFRSRMGGPDKPGHDGGLLTRPKPLGGVAQGRRNPGINDIAERQYPNDGQPSRVDRPYPAPGPEAVDQHVATNIEARTRAADFGVRKPNVAGGLRSLDRGNDNQ